MIVAAYVEELQTNVSALRVKQHLAANRMLFDYLVVSQVMPFNPAAAVRGPKHVVKLGKTPVLSAEEARKLLDSTNIEHAVGLRDRAMKILVEPSGAAPVAALMSGRGVFIRPSSLLLRSSECRRHRASRLLQDCSMCDPSREIRQTNRRCRRSGVSSGLPPACRQRSFHHPCIAISG